MCAPEPSRDREGAVVKPLDRSASDKSSQKKLHQDFIVFKVIDTYLSFESPTLLESEVTIEALRPAIGSAHLDHKLGIPGLTRKLRRVPEQILSGPAPTPFRRDKGPDLCDMMH